MNAHERQAERDRVRGLEGFHLTPAEANSPLWKRFAAALSEELQIKREQNDHPAGIAETTVLRGEIHLLKRILARTDEVGPESRQSAPKGPESAFPLTLS